MGQNVRFLAGVILKFIFLCENVRILIPISVKYVSRGQIIDKPSLAQISALPQSVGETLSGLMMTLVYSRKNQSLDLDEFRVKGHHYSIINKWR